MATTKKTTTKKTTRAPKKQHEPVDRQPEHGAEQVQAIPTKPEPMKTIMFQKLDGMESGDQFFEHNINGMNYRYRRGEWLTLPAALADAFMDKEQARGHVSPFVAGFQNTSKKLN